MTPDTFFCTLGKHEMPISKMRKPPPSCPERRQCSDCAAARARARYKRKPQHDWAARFLERVEERDGCWEWQGALVRGYGVTTIEGVQWIAHRVSYFLHHGDLPADTFICHHCDNKRCVNPDHLYAGDSQTNSDDAVARQRLDPPIGERNGHAVLTLADVTRMRSLYLAGGWSHATLAREFNVSPANVYKVVSYKSWRHVA